jgi:DivIVA domain-containing protein
MSADDEPRITEPIEPGMARRLVGRVDAWRLSPRPSLWTTSGEAFLVPLWAGTFGALAVASGTGTWDPNASRAVGLLIAVGSLVVSLALVGLTGLYLARPVERPRPTRAPSVGLGRFPAAAVGYEPDEVDRFWSTIDTRSASELRRVRFATSRPGYDQDSVDAALDAILADR